MAGTTSAPHRLRVALVFGGSLVADEVVDRPRPISLGYGIGDTLPLPGDHDGAAVTLMRPGEGGYSLSADLPFGGSVWVEGRRRPFAELRALGAPVALRPGDYGVLTLGAASVFFQMVAPVPSLGRGAPVWWREPTRLLALLLSLFLHASLLLLFFFALASAPPAGELELPLDLVRRFMVTPPPDLLEEPEAAAGGTGVDDPGFNEREEAGGEAAADEAGRVGRVSAPQEDTELAGERTGGTPAERVATLGVLGALRGGEGESSALEAALGAPDVGDILGGLGSSRTVIGRGTGGSALRGGGGGGGGTGSGRLFGSGALGTGVGAGRGAGAGRGRGGAGARGRPREEVRVRMQTERPRVSGYLSPEQIMRVVRRNRAAVRYCYENELQRQPSLSGRIEMRWRIARTGSVSSVRVGSTTMRNARVEGCIQRQVRRWRFPEPDGGEVDVTFPFIFGAG